MFWGNCSCSSFPSTNKSKNGHPSNTNFFWIFWAYTCDTRPCLWPKRYCVIKIRDIWHVLRELQLFEFACQSKNYVLQAAVNRNQGKSSMHDVCWIQCQTLRIGPSAGGGILIWLRNFLQIWKETKPKDHESTIKISGGDYIIIPDFQPEI